jgi:hypothetical protein
MITREALAMTKEILSLPVNAPSIEPLMQSLQATLADLDFAHERELAKVKNGSSDPSLKENVRAKLEARHRERRDPYVRQLTALHARIQSH